MKRIIENIESFYYRNFERIKASKKHKFGNMVAGLCQIVDGVILLLSLGNLSTKFQLKWNRRRYNNNFLLNKSMHKVIE